MSALKACLIALLCSLIVAGCAPAAAPAPTTLPPTVALPTAHPPTLTLPTTVPPTKTPPVIPEDPIEVVKAWIAALNDGDVETALAYFTENAQYTMGENARGKPNLRDLFEWLVAMETRWDPPDCRLVGSDAQCSFRAMDGCLAALKYDKERLPLSKAMFIFVDGRIRMVGGTATGNEGPGRGLIYDDGAATGVRQKHPDDFQKVVLNYTPYSCIDCSSRLAHSQEAAAIALRLCREYAETR